ncbi:protein O-mannosyl-transferase Tmtc2 [Onthophagus taurus]|uniref:protein O-mannosyl-transferase Tmtc2 n=1 Tax=Onthophagus taurus TaxID=166361 RepID=UPI000C1FE77E|nr:transmembrane and TPR repeat-containing protein CG4341 [Onthophagus taurus]
MDFVSLTCCSLAFLLYYNTLDAGFVYDDRRAILSNPDLLPSTPIQKLLENDFWGTPLTDSGSHGSYRPLCVLTFRLNYVLGGFQPWGYHLVNVLLHCLATALVVRVARNVLPKTKRSIGPWVTGLLFATHPIHTEAVAGVVGRADLAACNFYLLSFLMYAAHMKYRESISCNKHKCLYIKHMREYDKIKQARGKYKLMVNFSTCNWPRKFVESDFLNQRIETKTSSCCWWNRTLEWATLFGCLTLSLAAMLSKETGVTVLGVCALYDYLHSTQTNKKRKRSLIILAATGLVLLMIRLQGPTPQFSRADNPTAKEVWWSTRFMTFLYLPLVNVWLLLFPNDLSFDWGMDAIPRLQSIRDPRNLYSFTFYVCLGLLIKHCTSTMLNKKEVDLPEKCFCPVCHQTFSELHTSSCRTTNNNNSVNVCSCMVISKKLYREKSDKKSIHSTLILSMAFLTLPFLPATNLFFYVGFVVAERVLYLPSAGWCLLCGIGAVKLWQCRKYRVTLLVCAIATVIAFSCKTISRNRDWYDEESLYKSAVNINPPKAYGNLGSVLSSSGRKAEAEIAFRRALQYRPNMADVHYNLGVLLQGKNQLAEAIQSFRRAIQYRPSLALAYVNLGAALIAAGRCQEAVSVLRQGARLDGTGLKNRKEHETARVAALLQLGALYSDQGRLQRALATYREAAHSLPEHYPPQSVFNVLGETLARLQQDEEAERWYQAALNAQPDHIPAHITYGKLLAKNVSRTAEAEQWFRRAQKLAPDDATVYHHYGEFLASRGRYKEAAGLYEKAAELRPNDYELAVAAATAMRQAGRHLDAERWYRRAVFLKPTDVRGHTNLGAILHINGKYKEAADSYKEALKLQPNDVTTLTNLHKLHSVMT